MKRKNSVFLLLAAVIWGVAFVAQSAGMEYVGGFTFNCIRSILGGVVLLPVFLLHREKGQGSFGKRNKTLLTGGICCGVVLGIASNLQQQGIRYTSVGKAGFITALYIVLVPFFGLFLHKKVGRLVWIGLLFAVSGLYFLCMDGQFTVGRGDLLMLLCAAVFAVHILVVDHFAPLVNGVALSCVQFFTCGVLSGIPMLLFEQVSMEALAGAAVPILYAGVMSCGVAYTLQIVGQKNMNPTVASMILSLESVVSVLAGQLILYQRLTDRELLGCGLMFVAVVLAQL
ncbi:MAG: DMT family transporter [Acetatifactor sp.]|nr:DMT family transporter [Acetatifactor sp.]